MQEDNEIKLYLEECGFICMFEKHVFFKDKVELVLSDHNTRFMFRLKHIHKVNLFSGSSFMLNYKRINFLYDFLNHQYDESLKFRKEREYEDEKLDINLELINPRTFESRIVFINNRFLTVFLFLDTNRLEYKIIYKWHNRYRDGVDFNYAMYDEWSSTSQ
jgi:hypothetical protein